MKYFFFCGVQHCEKHLKLEMTVLISSCQQILFASLSNFQKQPVMTQVGAAGWSKPFPYKGQNFGVLNLFLFRFIQMTHMFTPFYILHNLLISSVSSLPVGSINGTTGSAGLCVPSKHLD